MIQQLEAKYELYDSIEDMLSLKAMSEILGRPVSHVNVHPVELHLGVAGSQKSFVDIDGGRYFLKRMSIEIDYQMIVSSDNECRSIRLWQYGLLDQLRPYVLNNIVACAHDSEGWAILMEDLTSDIFSKSQSFSSDLVFIFLDAMANVHAKFWNDRNLRLSELNLNHTASYINSLSYFTAQSFTRRTTSPISEWITEGWDILKDLLSPAVYRKVYDWHNNPQPLIDAVASFPYTLVHGDFHQGNLAYGTNDSPIIFDWQLASYSIMSIDLVRFLRESDMHISVDYDKGVQFYRDRLEIYLGMHFDETQWLVMVDLGRCIDAIVNIPIQAALSKKDDSSEKRKRRHANVKSQEPFLLAAIERLTQNNLLQSD